MTAKQKIAIVLISAILATTTVYYYDPPKKAQASPIVLTVGKDVLTFIVAIAATCGIEFNEENAALAWAAELWQEKLSSAKKAAIMAAMTAGAVFTVTADFFQDMWTGFDEIQDGEKSFETPGSTIDNMDNVGSATQPAQLTYQTTTYESPANKYLPWASNPNYANHYQRVFDGTMTEMAMEFNLCMRNKTTYPYEGWSPSQASIDFYTEGQNIGYDNPAIKIFVPYTGTTYANGKFEFDLAVKVGTVETVVYHYQTTKPNVDHQHDWQEEFAKVTAKVQKVGSKQWQVVIDGVTVLIGTLSTVSDIKGWRFGQGVSVDLSTVETTSTALQKGETHREGKLRENARDAIGVGLAAGTGWAISNLLNKTGQDILEETPTHTIPLDQPIGTDGTSTDSTILKRLTGIVAATLASILAAVEAIPEAFSEPETINQINLEPLELAGSAFTTRFPFSLPWDLKRQFDGFNVSEWDREFDLDLSAMPGGTITTIDFTTFDNVADAARKFELIMFDIGLILLTRRLLGGAA